MNDASSVAAERGPAQRDGSDGAGRRRFPYPFALLCVSYAVAAWAGLRWATVAGAASPIWPAAGIGLAGLVLGGRRLFPAIVMGLLAASLLSGADHPWWSQLVMGLGNAAGALAAVTLIRRAQAPAFERLASVRDVLVLLLAALLASLISTAAGSGALLLAGRLAWDDLATTVLTWFFGDAVGILIIAAIILTTVAARREKDRLFTSRQLLPFAFSLVAVAGLCATVFFGPPISRAWAIYPALVWVALIARVQGAAIAMLLVGIFASTGTLTGHGPFAEFGGEPDLVLLQQFLGVTAVTTLLLAAAVDERRAETRLRRIAADELAARQALQRTTSLLNLVGDAAPSMIYAKDLEGRYVYANRALLSMYGKPAEAVLGRSDLDFNPAGEAEAFRANDRRVMDSGEPVEVEEQLTLHGRLRTYFSVKAPLRDSDGAIAGIVGISTDITDRRQQQEEVERLARRAEIAQRGARSSLYEYDVVTHKVERDPMLAELCGLEPEDLAPDRPGWERFIHPDDLPQFNSTIAAALAGYERFALEYRVIGNDGRVTWVSDTGTIVRDEEGAARQIVGLVTDVTNQKHADERERLLAREVDHRAKNLLAVVQSVVQLTRADNGEQLKAGITGRIQSLARAHSLLADSRWEGVELTELAREELAPYAEELDGRIALHGPRLLLKPAAAQSLALVLHELATNAAKYGALSSPSGKLDLHWNDSPEEGLTLIWFERDGPPGRATAPTRSGFGSRLIKASIERQLRGSLRYDWATQGLTVTMTIAPDYVAPSDEGEAPARA